eukprot:superscaffoldBa00001424_g10478
MRASRCLPGSPAGPSTAPVEPRPSETCATFPGAAATALSAASASSLALTAWWSWQLASLNFKPAFNPGLGRLQSEDVAVAHIHGEAAEFWWEKEANRVTPLCKAVDPHSDGGLGVGRGPRVPLACCPHARGLKRDGQTEEAALGPEQNLRTPSVAFSTAEKREMGRVGDRWAHPPPAGTATGICP